MGGSDILFDPVTARAAGAALSIIFLFGAWQKLRDLALFAAALDNYALLPAALVVPGALVVAACEAAAGLLLLLPGTRTLGAATALLLLAMVTGAVAVNLLRGRANIDCGCGGLGSGVGEHHLSWALVVRNLLLAAAVGVATSPGTACALHWIDYVTVAGCTLALLGLYASANQLMANQPRLAALRNH